MWDLAAVFKTDIEQLNFLKKRYDNLKVKIRKREGLNA